jgi:hypothetical protein
VDGIPPSLLNGVGVGALLVLLFWMLATEKLVTGPAHKRELADKDRQIDLKDDTIKTLTGSVQKLTLNSELTVQLLRSIDKVASEKVGDE